MLSGTSTQRPDAQREVTPRARALPDQQPNRLMLLERGEAYATLRFRFVHVWYHMRGVWKLTIATSYI